MRRRVNLPFLIMGILPALLLYLVFFIYPSLDAFKISLYKWSGFTPDMDYVGLGNFKELFSDSHFWSVVMRNTLFIIFIGGVALFALAFIFANVLTSKIRGRSFLRAAIFFPNVVNPIALAVLWSFIYNKKWGLLNNVLGLFGINEVTWTSPNSLFWSLLVALVWIYVGFFTVILVSALDRIPPHMSEAAVMEGATEFQIFTKIKIPLIWDVLQTAIILWGIMAVKEFAFLYAWGGTGAFPQPGSQNLAVYMFVTAFGRRVSVFRMGYSTAMGVIMVLLVGLIVLVVHKLMFRETVEY